jgi:hypothetical protein
MICNSIGCKKWDIGNFIRTLLLEDDEIRERVGNHIYPIVAAENTVGDFIVYSRQNYSKSIDKMGVYEDIAKEAVVVVSDNYDRSIELAELIDNALTGTHRSGECKFDIMLDDSTETFDDNKYIQTLLFTIK